MINKDTKILIVGLGLIGGSYAKGLSKKGYKVYGLDVDEEAIEFARKHQYILDGETNANEQFIRDKDIIILCLYPHMIVEWINSNRQYFKSSCIITDTCGVKCSFIKDLPSDLNYLSHHPMAGRECSGVANADETIFKNANYIITPYNKVSDDTYQTITQLGEILEFKNIVELSIEKHDEMIGFLSQLTHVIAISLMTSRDCTHLAKYSGDSFRDLTRIAKINENMWAELFIENKEYLINEIDTFINQLENIKDKLDDEDEEALKEIMKLSTSRRGYFDK